MNLSVKQKFRSRKFQVWLVWFIFAVVALFQPAALPTTIIFNFFGWISIVYIGGNVAQKFLYNQQGNGTGTD